MAKMYGDRGREQWDSPDNKTKSVLKHREERAWKTEADDEIDGFERDHASGLCSDRITGMGGCEYCYFENDHGDGWYGDLDFIDGVTYNERR
jgi:hypothetical protein